MLKSDGLNDIKSGMMWGKKEFSSDGSLCLDDQ